MTLKDRIFHFVKNNSGKSAYEISESLRADKSVVSSYLYKFVRRNRMTRLPVTGPRKGFAYFINYKVNPIKEHERPSSNLDR